MMRVKLKEKITPKWYEGRKWIAKLLVALARKIEPNSIDAWLYDVEKRVSEHIRDLHEQYMDAVVFGKSMWRNKLLDDVPYVEASTDNVHKTWSQMPAIYWSKDKEPSE